MSNREYISNGKCNSETLSQLRALNLFLIRVFVIGREEYGTVLHLFFAGDYFVRSTNEPLPRLPKSYCS